MLRDVRRAGVRGRASVSAAAPLKYLAGYPPEFLALVRELIATNRAVEGLSRRYPESHHVLSNGPVRLCAGRRNIL